MHVFCALLVLLIKQISTSRSFYKEKGSRYTSVFCCINPTGNNLSVKTNSLAHRDFSSGFRPVPKKQGTKLCPAVCDSPHTGERGLGEGSCSWQEQIYPVLFCGDNSNLPKINNFCIYFCSSSLAS